MECPLTKASSLKVFISDRFDFEAKSLLSATPGVELVATKELAEALLIRSRTHIDEKFLKFCPELKYIITSTSGFDHIDLEACAAKNIKAFYTPMANADSTAELTMALIINSARKFTTAQTAIKSGDWARDRLVGRQLHGLTLGVVGLGRVGSRVSKIAASFGMTVLAYDRYVEDSQFEKSNCTRASWAELVPVVDIISLHVPLTSETRRMINSKTLENLGENVCLVNAARGELIPEKIALDLLREHPTLTFAFDVMDQEPLSVHSPLTTHPRVLLSPHIGASTHEAFRASSFAAVETIAKLISGAEPSDSLPPKAQWAKQKQPPAAEI
jgi:D-3-phosphoglycerate dehydrogenase / 2-oxoglutarate reductase